MAWNEPGGGNRDPWKGKKDGPDIEALFRRLRDGLTGLIGGNSGNGSGDSGGSRFGGIMMGVVAIALVWAASTTWVSIDAQHVGVVLRFGKFQRVMQNGLNLKFPSPIEQVTLVETTSRPTNDDVRMLTKDENIVQINFNVQYRVSNAQQYLFAATAPDETLKQAAESAVRQVIGSSDMGTILSSQGSDMASEAAKLLQQTLDAYAIGLNVTSVQFQSTSAPQQVKEAFDDVNNASNNQKQFINDALAYAAQVVPLAKGEAARILADAEGYRLAQIAKATGDAQRFALIEAQYRSAPEVTRRRLYLETMQQILSRSQKVIDGSEGKNILYLPIDKVRPDPAAAAAVGVQPDRAIGGSR